MHAVASPKVMARNIPRARTLGDFLVPGMLNLSIEKALVMLSDLCYRMQESQVLAQRVLNRALFLRQEVENKPVGTRIQSDVILRFGELVGRAIQFLRKYSSKTLVARVAANRRFLDGLREVHARLDYFFGKVYLASRPEMTEWKTHWESDVKLQQRLLQGFLSNRVIVNAGLTERGLEESLTEAKFELANRELTPKQVELMQLMFDQFRHHHKMFLPLPVPLWFVARDEVQYVSEPFAVGSYGALHRGMLERSKNKGFVKSMYSDSKQTQAAPHSEGQLWTRLDHPDVRKMKGGWNAPELERSKNKLVESELGCCQALIVVQLKEVARLCGVVGMAQGMSNQVRQRLVSLAAALSVSRTDHTLGVVACLAATKALADVVGRFVAFLERTTRLELVYRFACSRKVVARVRGFHEELDWLLSQHAATLAVEAGSNAHDWLDRFENARENMWLALDALSRDRLTLQRDLPDIQAQEVALTYIMYESKRPTGTYTSAELQVLGNAFSTITRFSRAKLKELPRWFLPPYDVDFEAQTARKPPAVELKCGTLGGAPVVMKVVRADVADEKREVFKHAVSGWFEAGEESQHVVRLHGASHVGEVSYVIDDVAGGKSLRDYVASEPQRLWEALYGAAKGLQTLHNRGVVHGRLDADGVVVAADGTAKIMDNILSMLGLLEPAWSSGDSAHETEWGLGGDHHAPTFASDVLALAVCVVDALGGGTDPFHSRPDAVTAEQWGLVQRMYSERPNERPSIADVVTQFGAFAEAERTQREAV